MGPHIIWMVHQIVHNSDGRCCSTPMCSSFQEYKLNGIESTGEIKEHDPHGAHHLLQVTESSMEEEDAGTVHSHARLG